MPARSRPTRLPSRALGAAHAAIQHCQNGRSVFALQRRKKWQKIPERCHTITPHLAVREAAKAIEFYKKAFGPKEHARMPGPDGKSVMHAELQIGDSVIFLNDEFPEMGAKSPQTLNGTPVTIHLYVKDANAWFKRAVDAGAKVTMPLEDTFWGDRFGQVVDPFGHRWSIATHVEDVVAERDAEARRGGLRRLKREALRAPEKQRTGCFSERGSLTRCA